jgi:hypothetical protein
MRIIALLLLLVAPAAAKTLNVEFKFTPYTGDTKEDHVQVVPGKARVFVNNVPIATQDVEAHEVPVMFDEREIAPAVWVTAESLGPIVRKGKNTIRFEFEPSTPGGYRAQLRWASITDQVRKESGPGHEKSTNQAGEGADEKDATGRLVMEREFVADFAIDQPWHHLPPVTAVTDEDREALAARVQERVEWFKPDFSPVYKALAGDAHADVAGVRKRKCLEAAYKAGVRMSAVPASQLEIVTTGGPEVVVQAKGAGPLYPPDRAAFEKIKGDQMQTCASTALSMVYRPRLVAVRTPVGNWEIVY